MEGAKFGPYMEGAKFGPYNAITPEIFKRNTGSC